MGVQLYLEDNSIILFALQKNVHSTKFMSYYMDQVVGKIASVANMEEGEDTKLEVLKQLADMAQWCPELENLPEKLANLYTAIKVSHLLPSLS